MCEDVDEELASAGPDPGGDLAEQSLVVLHVLEHLDGDHAVEPVLELIRVEGCYITCISNIGTNETSRRFHNHRVLLTTRAWLKAAPTSLYVYLLWVNTCLLS